MIFKSTLVGGFDKEQVLQYIDTLIEKSSSKENQLKDQVEELMEQNETANDTATKCEATVKFLQQTITQKDDELNNLSSLVSTLNLEIEKQKRIVTERNNSIDIQIKKLQESEISRHNDQRLSSEQVGELLVKAQETANEIIEKATIESDKITLEANDQAAAITEKTKSQAAVFISQINQLKSNFGLMREDIATILASMSKELDNMGTALDAGFTISTEV